MRLVKRTLAALLVGALATTATPPSARAQPGGGDPAAPGPGENTRAPIALDERELAELKELEGDYKHYIGEAERHQQRMRAVIQRELDARIKELEKRYAEGIAAAEAERHRRHLETVALLEKFIADYPDHEQFTPDAMFRLADLYLDESEWDLEQRELVALPTDNLIADYSKSLAMWQTILDRFPKFRQLPRRADRDAVGGDRLVPGLDLHERVAHHLPDVADVRLLLAALVEVQAPLE